MIMSWLVGSGQSADKSITHSCVQVLRLRGIGKLLQLLQSDNEEVQHVAAGALRNVVYQSHENKIEVKENDGLAVILDALESSRDVETRRELTGQFLLAYTTRNRDIFTTGFSA